MSEKLYDLIIIGHAAAGPAAAIYAARRHLDVLIISKDIGGEVALSGDIGNWPSVIKTTGIELAKEFHEHVKSYNVPIEEGTEVVSIAQEKNIHIITAKDILGKEKIYRTKTIIVATGIHPRELDIPGEKELKGRGITYCTVCDGPLFSKKITATIGAGNSAVESVLMMGEIAEKVYVVTKYGPDDQNGGFPKAENILVEKMMALKNIEIVYNARTTSIGGEKSVESLTYTDTKANEEKTLEIQGAMVHIGVIPNSDFITCVEKDKGGQIIVDKICKTSCEGIFAAGDVTDMPYNQISIAVGMGATAALTAIDYLNHFE
jgi:alkyl hydroperoxide reductase subunit AhpF